MIFYMGERREAAEFDLPNPYPSGIMGMAAEVCEDRVLIRIHTRAGLWAILYRLRRRGEVMLADPRSWLAFGLATIDGRFTLHHDIPGIVLDIAETMGIENIGPGTATWCHYNG